MQNSNCTQVYLTPRDAVVCIKYLNKWINKQMYLNKCINKQMYDKLEESK